MFADFLSWIGLPLNKRSITLTNKNMLSFQSGQTFFEQVNANNIYARARGNPPTLYDLYSSTDYPWQDLWKPMSHFKQKVSTKDDQSPNEKIVGEEIFFPQEPEFLAESSNNEINELVELSSENDQVIDISSNSSETESIDNNDPSYEYEDYSSSTESDSSCSDNDESPRRHKGQLTIRINTIVPCKDTSVIEDLDLDKMKPFVRIRIKTLIDIKNSENYMLSYLRLSVIQNSSENDEFFMHLAHVIMSSSQVPDYKDWNIEKINRYKSWKNHIDLLVEMADLEFAKEAIKRQSDLITKSLIKDKKEEEPEETVEPETVVQQQRKRCRRRKLTHDEQSDVIANINDPFAKSLFMGLDLDS